MKSYNEIKNATYTLSRKLRKNQTESEKIFWQLVRNRKFHGHKFLRQHPIIFEIDGMWRFFIADFYCAKLKLIIEIDGSIHLMTKEYDQIRDYILNKLDYKIARIPNELVKNSNRLTSFLESVLSDCTH